MAKYTLGIKTREMYAGKEKESVGEVMEINGYCETSDDNDTNKTFEVKLTSDTERYWSTVDFAASQVIKSEVDVDSCYKVRKNFSVYPRINFYGNVFQTEINKIVPQNGNFKYFGIVLNVVPVNVEQEFSSGSGANIPQWGDL